MLEQLSRGPNGSTSLPGPTRGLATRRVSPRHSSGVGAGPSAQDHDKNAWGSDDPTKAAFPFAHGHALAEAGHEVRIFLLGEAVGLMRRSVAEAVVPVGWPPVAEVLGKVAERKIPIYACGTCALARGVTEEDLANWGATFGSPKIFVSLVADTTHSTRYLRRFHA